MNRKIKIGNGIVTVTDRTYIGAGGEAAIYANGNEVIKLYHDPTKMIPVTKIQELAAIKPPNVIKPLQVAYDPSTGQPVGYTMRYLRDTEPLCKFFTRAFKQDHNISPAMVIQLVKTMQLTAAGIHQDKCLIVDFNEMNELVADTFVDPLFIDVDSYQTPSHPATAIMLSIRDPKIHGCNWTVYSDWFSFAILAFQLYVNIHPFKGKHPDYDAKDWSKRMQDGVSVFDRKVKLPPVCNPLSVVPKRHLDWFKAVFEKGERSEPPLPDGIAPAAVPVQIVTVQGSSRFEITDMWSVTGTIKSVFAHAGVVYMTTDKALYFGSILSHPSSLSVSPNRPTKILACAASDGSPVLAIQTHADRIMFKAVTGQELDTTNTSGFFVRNNAVYTCGSGRLSEVTFVKMGDRFIPRSRDVENVSALSAKVYDGVVIQDLLGKKYVTVPYATGRCCNLPVPELNGMRVVDARGEKNVVIVACETKGVYHRFIITLNRDFDALKVRQEADIAYDGINFTVLDNGLIVLLSAPDTLEIISGSTITEFDNPPITTNMRLFNQGGAVYFINDNTVHRLKMR